MSSRDGGEGARVWLVPDCYLPEKSSGGLNSHEAICVLNTSEREARLLVSLYFEDQAPVRDIQMVVPAERTRHIRMDSSEELGEVEVPRGVPYAVRLESDIPIVVQCSRMDTSQEALALMTVVAHAAG